MNPFVRARALVLLTLAVVSLLAIPQPARANVPTYAPGTPDPSFGYFGRVERSAGIGTDAAKSVATLPDGGTLVVSETLSSGGPRPVLTKFAPDGSFDVRFGRRGRSVVAAPYSTNAAPSQVLVRADGRIVVLAGGYGSAILLQVLANGAPDLTFGDHGVVYLGQFPDDDPTFPDYYFASGATLAPNGDVIVVGNRAGRTAGRLALYRVTVRGLMRPLFGVAGLVNLTGGFHSDGPPRVDALGRLIVPGDRNGHAALMRFTPFGVLDPTFGHLGVAETVIADSRFRAVDVGTGVVVGAGDAAVGTTGQEPVVVRFDALGATDVSFGDGGRAVLPLPAFDRREQLSAVEIQDDTITVAGAAGTWAHQDIGFGMRIAHDGSLDATYGDAGRADVTMGYHGFEGATIRHGAVTGVGQVGENSAMAKFDADGVLDVSRAASGNRVFEAGVDDYASSGAVTAVARADGKILYANSYNGDFFVARLLANGDLDRTFGDGGTMQASIGPAGEIGVVSMALDSTNRIYVAFGGDDGNVTPVLVRLLPDGAVDEAFGVDGFVAQPALDDARQVLVDANDQPVVLSIRTVMRDANGPVTPFHKTLLRRYTTQGTPDASFGDAGVVVGDGDVYSVAMAIAPSGGIVVGGQGPTANPLGLQRFASDGSPMLGFVAPGRDVTELRWAAGLAVDSADRIVVIGTGDDRATAARFLATGQPDPAFAAGGAWKPAAGERYAFGVRGPLLQPDGKILFAASSTDQNTAPLIRLNTDGTIDTTFGRNGAAARRTPSGGAMEQDGVSAILFHQGSVLMAGSAFEQFLLGQPAVQSALCLVNGLGAPTTFEARSPDGSVAQPPVPTQGSANALGGDIATGDIDGDGVDEVVIGAGAGEAPTVEVYRGAARIASFLAYPAGWMGGVNVAVDDLDGDGRAEIVTGPGAGLWSKPVVRVFTPSGDLVGQFQAYEPFFRGGVDVAITRHFDKLETTRIVTAPGPGRPSLVKTFTRFGMPGDVAFHAFGLTFLGGVRVATLPRGRGVVADGIIVGAGPGGTPTVRAFDAYGRPQSLASYVFEPTFRGGVDVSAVRLTDGTTAIAVASGPGRAPEVRILNEYGQQVSSSFSAGDEHATGGVRLDDCVLSREATTS